VTELQAVHEGHGVRGAIARALGVDAAARAAVIRDMLAKPHEDRALYWLALLLAMGIATFGLVLSSAGVVIGAMLIAPLMTPIVELSMSLVITSTYLLLRSLIRVVASVLAVSLGAALITLVLPFHVATPEILARTSPTVLDLFVAVFCAVAAAATTTRPTGNASSTAAGTAIGISLVPPLCVVGFGIGSRQREIAEGAALLFTANFCAILAFAALMFWLVDYRALPDGGTKALQPESPIDRRTMAMARVLETRFALRSRAAIRVLVPAVLLLLVIRPLTRALLEVSDEVRARAAVGRVVSQEALLRDAIRVEPLVERGRLELRAVVVGTDREALELQERLRAALAQATGASPQVQVLAVPRASAVERRAATAPARDTLAPAVAASVLHDQVRQAVQAHLPDAGSTVLDMRVEALDQGGLRVDLALADRALDGQARAILEQALRIALRTPVDVQAVALPTRETPDAVAGDWWDAIGVPLVQAAPFPRVSACVTAPRSADAAAARARVESWLADWPTARRALADGPAWQVRFTRDTCDAPPDGVPGATGAGR
jgi:uncharacterized hydrophobic protein (TIGR00271 family)